LAGLSVLPFLLSNQLLGGGIWLYYDAFMMLFLFLSLWVIYVEPKSNWLYITMAAMMLSKETGIFFVAPLLLAHYYETHEVKRTLKLLLTVTPFFVYVLGAGIVVGDVLYYYHHWQSLSWGATLSGSIWGNVGFYLINWGFVFYAMLVLPGFIMGLVAMVISGQRYYLPLYTIFIIVVVCGIGWGFVPYHMFSLLYVGMFMTAFTMKLFGVGKKDEQVTILQTA